MRNKYLFLFIGFIFSLAFSFCTSPKNLGSNLNPEFENWKKERIANLRTPFGWHSLTGLYWLKKDSVSVGTSQGFDINLKHNTSVNIGTLLHKEQDWFFKPAQENQIKSDDKFVNDEIQMLHDQTGNPTTLNYKSLYFYIIKREDNYGIRLKDTLNPARLSFDHIPIYDFNPSFVKNAQVKWATSKDSILITNAQSVVSSVPLKGWLLFDHKGTSYSLAGTDGGKDTWFIVFGDETNSGTTYGAGRFLYVSVEEGASAVTLDFNRAENPPCYFTAFATCPLPPKENKLALEIHAGERAEH